MFIKVSKKRDSPKVEAKITLFHRNLIKCSSLLCELCVFLIPILSVSVVKKNGAHFDLSTTDAKVTQAS